MKALVKGKTRREFTLVDLLGPILTITEGEQPSFDFDYVSMYMRCHEVLGQIALDCGEIIKTLVHKTRLHMHSDY
jgi:hypothetical protein